MLIRMTILYKTNICTSDNVILYRVITWIPGGTKFLRVLMFAIRHLITDSNAHCYIAKFAIQSPDSIC